MQKIYPAQGRKAKDIIIFLFLGKRMAYHVVNPYYSPADFMPGIRQRIIQDLHPARGDIIALNSEDRTYRNDGKAIFDGTDIIRLDETQDEYGNVPSTFFVGDEFPVMHWSKSINHNTIVWIDTKKHRDQLLDLVDGDPRASEDDEAYYVAYVSFPLGSFKILVAKANRFGDEDSRQEYEAIVRRGDPLPVGAMNEAVVVFPWIRGF